MLNVVVAALALVPQPQKLLETGGVSPATNVVYETDRGIAAEGYRLAVNLHLKIGFVQKLAWSLRLGIRKNAVTNIESIGILQPSRKGKQRIQQETIRTLHLSPLYLVDSFYPAASAASRTALAS